MALVIPEFQREDVDKDDLACYFAGDQIDFNRCRALVRDFTKTKPCQIRQCKELIQGDKTFNIDGEHVGLGRVHQGMYNNRQQVSRYVPTTPPATGFIKLSDDLALRELNIEELYFGLNESYRKRLELFTGLYRELVQFLVTRKQTLQTNLMTILGKEVKLHEELTSKTEELESLAQHGEDPELAEQIEVLRQRNNELDEELKTVQQEKTLIETQLETCVFTVRSMNGEMKEKTDALKMHITDLTGEQFSDDNLNQARLLNSKQLAQIKQNRADKMKRILDSQGLHVLIRIRCDFVDKKTKLEHSIDVRNKFIKVEEDILTSKSPNFELWNDRNSESCEKNEFFKKENPKTSREDYQKYLDEQNNSQDEYSKININFGKWIAQNKQSVSDQMERSRFGVAEEVKGMVDGTIDPDNYLYQWKQYHETKLGMAKPPGKEVSGRKKQKDAPYISPDKQALYTTAYHAIERFAREEILSYQFTISSGVEYIKKSTLGFIKKQTQENMIETITILNIGGSASGKTTASKALLKFVYLQYITKFPDLINDNAIVTVDFKEVYREDGIIKISDLNTTPNTNSDTFMYPHLVQNSNRGHKREPATNIICGVFNEIERTRNSCASLGAGVNGFNAMHRLLELDTYTESNRETKYTSTNPAGSSRGVKIITLKFVNKERGKTITINLIDTPGFESADEKKDLEDFYDKRIDFAINQDGAYKKYMSNKDKQSEIKRLVAAIQNETVFIFDTLTYLQTLVLKYKQLKSVQNMTSDSFDGNMNDIKQMDTNANPRNDPSSETSWATRSLDLFPQKSTVVVLGAFKGNVQTNNEIFAAQQTIRFLKKIVE